MKVTFIIILTALVIVCCNALQPMIYNEDGTLKINYCSEYTLDLEKGDTVKAYSSDFCRSLSCNEDDDDGNACFRCCYYHAKLDDGNTYRGCYPMSYSKFANASELEPGDLGLNDNFSDLSIHCNSKYLTLTMGASFISFVFALF